LTLDKPALGLGVSLPVVGETSDELAPERRVFPRERQVGAQTITEAQATVERVLLIDKMQVVGPMRRGR
jgi:hypothetical protein